MKKFAVAFLSVFMMIGGVLLAACDKKVSLSLLTSEEITIYTNDEQAENFGKDEVDVRVENSSFGIRAEVLKGGDLIRVENMREKTTGRYSFDIVTLESKKSGEAEVKVSSIEDEKQSKIIVVNVKTILEGLDAVQDDNADARTSRFVVKSSEVAPVYKTLSVGDYFELNPGTANEYEIDWTIDDEGTDVTELKDGTETIAKIVDRKLWVSENYKNPTLTIKAKDKTKGVYNFVSLEVLDNSTIESFSFDDTDFIVGGVLQTSEKTVQLKRNNSKTSSAAGEIVVNTNYDVVLTPKVYLDGIELSREKYQKYIYFNVTDVEIDKDHKQNTYAFTVDALDVMNYKIFDKLEIYLAVGYKNYNYDLLTGGVDEEGQPFGSKIVLETSYEATRIELYNKAGEGVNESNIDVFSHYVGEDGYKIQAVLLPDDVEIDNYKYRISIRNDQESMFGINYVSDFAMVYTRGVAVGFTQQGSSFVSEEILSTNDVYIAASGAMFDVLENVQIDFISCSNENAKTSVNMNFYKISTDNELTVEGDLLNGTDIENLYISSNALSDRALTMTFKVSGMTTTSGLSVVTDNPYFSFGEFEFVESGTERGVDYVVFKVEATLSKTNYEGVANFRFEHVSGKVSMDIKLNAFIPILSASISNSDKSSAAVYKEENCDQNYMLVEGAIVENNAYANESVSHLMLEAGALLPIATSAGGATLEGVDYYFLNYSEIREGLADQALVEKMDQMFAGRVAQTDIDFVLANFFDDFEEVDDTAPFSLTENKLVLVDEEFKGFVLVMFTGFGETHEEVTLARVFAVESFVPVQYLYSNVSTAKLYSDETLSYLDAEKSYIDVTLSLRSDAKVPTYSNDLSFFTFSSSDGISFENGLNKFVPNTQGDVIKNGYYTLSDFSFVNSGLKLRFRITANSTKFLSQMRDILTITYEDVNGFVRQTEIQIEIKNVKRIEKVEWTTQTGDNEIYFNLKSGLIDESNFAIVTSYAPSDAYDTGLYHFYDSIVGESSDIAVNTSDGRSYNVKLDAKTGGYGYLYLLPNDMIKTVAGSRCVLLYKYSVDANGERVETPVLKPLSELGDFFDSLVDENLVSAEFDQYFLNNDGERIYYKDTLHKVRITIADGKSEETAIRAYTQSDLASIDYSLFYKVMNDISLNGWKTLSASSLSGSIFGKDEDITLNFAESSQSFIDKIDSKGSIKNLTFVGDVTFSRVDAAGFVANENNGLVDNVRVDINFSGNKYQASSLNVSGAARIGGLVGWNAGTVSNSGVYGLNISASGATEYLGGIAGYNSGKIVDSGVEFYDFVDAGGNTIPNQINIAVQDKHIGGLVGYAASGSLIDKSYVYAYPLVDNHDSAQIFGDDQIVGAYVGYSEGGVTIDETFAYLGDVYDYIGGEGSATITNSYITYYDNTDVLKIKFKIDNITEISNIGEGDLPSAANPNGSSYWQTAMTALNGNDAWVIEDIDPEVNFGFMYLKNVRQSIATDVNSLALKNVEDSQGNVKVVTDATGSKGILFAYVPTTNVGTSAETSRLTEINTIKIEDLFGVSEEEADSLILSTDSKDVVLSKNGLRVVNANLNEFSIVVHSKMDYSKTKTFNFVILNSLPKLGLTIDGQTMKDDQLILLQKGEESARTVNYILSNSLYLGGSQFYQTYKDSYSINVEVEQDKDYLSAVSSGLRTVLTGLEASEENYAQISANLVVGGLATEYQEIITQKRNGNFRVSVYDGATSLVVLNASSLIVKPARHASFQVVMETDNADDNLLLSVNFDGVDIVDDDTTDNQATFVVDTTLILEATWVEERKAVGTKYEKTYNVIVSIKDSQKHLISKDYDLTLSINALSLKNKTTLVRTLGLKVNTQEIKDVEISAYKIENRQVKNSVLYLRKSTEIANTLMPSSDAIVAVTIDPAFAMMTHFKLTYSLSAIGNGAVGTVNISKLSYGSLYGYYVNSSSTQIIENGIIVYLTEQDKKGDGVFYFRIYISGAFETQSDLKLTLTCYNNEKTLRESSQNLNVENLSSAKVKVNGVSNYVMSKGSVATVTVDVGLEEELDNISLQNNGSGISLSAMSKPEDFGTFRRYTLTLIAYVDAKLANGDENGNFYVNATVRKVVNGKTELKKSQATVCLVDFAVDGNGIKVEGSGATQSYNGKEYDVFYSYVNATYKLKFDYPMLPEEYLYDSTDVNEVTKVNDLKEERSKFETNNYYANDDADYYINYDFNELTGKYEVVTLKQQLWYAENEETATAIYNGKYINQNNKFTIEDNEAEKAVEITGKRTGTQLMMLRTVIWCQGIEFVYDYYFLIVVEVWSDEETPTQINSAEEFISFATNSAQADDYILMQDIVLDNYDPINTDLINSLDGNGYTIHINSFAMPTEGELRLALFDQVTGNTTLKNVRVNIYNGGDIAVDITKHTTINIAGFAIENYGIIYNCEVVSYYDEDYQISTRAKSGLIVEYTRGQGMDGIKLTAGMQIESNVAGFVVENHSSITNSRVGGESFRHVIEADGIKFIKTEATETFVLEAQGNVAGFVISNGTSTVSGEGVVGENVGYISASFADNMQINNHMESTSSITAGFVINNYNFIHGSYIEGVRVYGKESEKDKVNLTGSNINAMGVVAGFVYENDGQIKNSYANIAIENSEAKGSLVSGFVYMNNIEGEILLCYSACKITLRDLNEMQFSGVDELANSLNQGKISQSYYYNEGKVDNTNEKAVSSGALAVSEVKNESTFYGFSFASSSDAYDGIWAFDEDDMIMLVAANKVAISNRYAVVSGVITNIFYNRNILDYDTMISVDLSYGSDSNPIIIRDAMEFAKATGKAQDKEISYYKEYYNNTSVFGNYRLVNNLDFSAIDQNAENNDTIKLTTTTKTFSGLLDGNGFTVSNINLGSSQEVENYGLFAKLDNAVIMNLNMIVNSIHNKQANIVGTIAGTAIDSRLISIKISPVDNQSGGHTSILGNNVVGGVVGMLFGNSKIADVKSSDVTVYSSYNNDAKTIGSNNDHVGKNLRDLVESGAELKNKVSNISYAGGLVGYVDAYRSATTGTLTYTAGLDISDYDIVTVNVSNSVDIYAEVAGGLFGYISGTSLIYDATLVLNADMALTNPSYIISKNLYAGGIAGESYGGLFAAYAVYEDELQKTIEENQNAYYNGNLTVERGQQSIFSYASKAENIKENTNEPLVIGGLVGFMGGGYINVGYNKLNVVSYGKNTLAVGGIIGMAGFSSVVKFDLSLSTNTKQTNIYLYEVFASGDTSIANVENAEGISAGIIGSIDATNTSSQTPVITLKNVNAVNYYSYEGGQLLNDVPEIVDINSVPTAVAKKHFMLAGKAVIKNADNSLEFIDSISNYFYLLRTDDFVYDLYKQREESIPGPTSSPSIGGYSKLSLAGNALTIKDFGFTTSGQERTVDYIFDITHIGDASVSNFSTAYARMYNNFLPVGWTERYWVHDEGVLFPRIELSPRFDIIFLDATAESIFEVFEMLKGDDAVTVVVRGMMTPDAPNSTDCMDIDLTTNNTGLTTYLQGKGYNSIEEYLGNVKNTLKNRLVSYYEYMDSTVMGVVTKTDGVVGGGKVGDNVGIIIDTPIFQRLESGASIEGVTFYLNPDDATNNLITYNLIGGTDETDPAILDATIRSSRIVLNAPVKLEARPFAGILANCIADGSLYNVEVITKPDVTISVVGYSATGDDSIYMGVLVGKISKTEVSKRSVIQDVKFVAWDDNNKVKADADVQVSFATDAKAFENYAGTDPTNLYTGLYAGLVEKSEEATSKISLGIQQSDSVAIDFSVGDVDKIDNIYLGGYVGKVNGVDSISIQGGDSDKKGIVMLQNSNMKTLYAGLIFGDVTNVGSVSGLGDSPLKGAIGQGSSDNGNTYYTTETAYIGGVAGKINSAISLESVSIDLSVGRQADEKGKLIKDVQAGLGKDVVVENQYDYETSPYQVDIAHIGGYFGQATETVTVQGYAKLSGNIDLGFTNEPVQGSDNVYNGIGGMIGTLRGALNTTVSSTNEMKIFLRKQNTSKQCASVGGVVGYVVKVTRAAGDTTEESININTDNPSLKITDLSEVVSSITYLKFGGAIGYVEREDYTNADAPITINSVVYGGAVRAFGEGIDGSDLTVGGVVGEFNNDINDATEADDKTTYQISQCYSYGDVFVNYRYEDTDEKRVNDKLGIYNFGGIVGKASVIKVSDCYSLMTSFNNRLTDNVDLYNVGAIVGANAGIVTYKANKYASGVAMAYQEKAKQEEKDQNSDYAYASTSKYLGYGATKEYSQTDILTGFPGQGIGAEGTKLNPHVISKAEDYENLKFDAENKTHGITWVAVSAGFEITEALVENITNVAFVGNGQTITSKRGSVDETHILEKNDVNGAYIADASFGGLFDSLGKDATGAATDAPNYSMVSGVVMDLDIHADFKSGASAVGFGGIAGETYGNAFIYGSTIKGNMSVGGTNALRLGGVVGKLFEGMINECSVVGDVIYRAKDSGILSGVANCINGNTTIKATYSSGMLTSYVSDSMNIASLAYGFKDNDVTSHDLLNSYSISTIVRNDVEGTATSEGSNWFVNNYKDNGTEYKTFNVAGCYYVNENNFDERMAKAESLKAATTTTAGMAVPYSGTIIQKPTLLATFEPDPDAKPATDWESISTWYYNPYVNYGFASHGFGYMKNVTTYTRNEIDLNVHTCQGTTISDVSEYSDLKTIENIYFVDSDSGPNKNGGYDNGEKLILSERTSYKVNAVGGEEEVATVSSYTYSAVDYAELMGLVNLTGDDDKVDEIRAKVKPAYQDGWYLGVPNAGKFTHMVEETDECDAAGTSYSSGISTNAKFVITQDIDMQYAKDTIDASKTVGLPGTEINDGNGNISYNFSLVVDGNNKSLNFDFTESDNVSCGLFGTFRGTLINLSVKNINIDYASGNVAGIAKGFEGTMNNISVDGNITSKGRAAYNVGGVVAERVGTAETNFVAVDSMVNITATGTANGYAGGIIAKVNGDSNAGLVNIIQCSNNGIINTNGGQAGGIVGWVQNAGSNPGKAVIKYSSNGSAVLAGVVEANDKQDISYLAGGIVGNANKGTTVTIDHCYNTGYVAAGNYKYTATSSKSENSYASYAGGIIANHEGKAASVTNCVNDGAVQAIGAPVASKEDAKTYKIEAFEVKLVDSNHGLSNYNGTDWGAKYSGCYDGYHNEVNGHKIYVVDGQVYATVKSDSKINSGEPYMNDSPENITFVLKLTYSENKDRQVHAYGIGNGLGSTKNNGNVTTIDNVWNDGNVGEFSQYTTITMNRQYMLDSTVDWTQTDAGSTYFSGHFDMLSSTMENNSYKKAGKCEIVSCIQEELPVGIWTNGVDAHNMPTRVYMQDRMTRWYYYDYTNKNPIEEDMTSTNIYFTGDKRLSFSPHYRHFYLTMGKESYIESTLYKRDFGSNFKNRWLDENDDSITFPESTEYKVDPRMQGDVDYYTSAEFLSYDDAIRQKFSHISNVDVAPSQEGKKDKDGTVLSSINNKGKDKDGNVVSLAVDGIDQVKEEYLNTALSRAEEIKENSRTTVQTTVNGNKTAVVYNGQALYASYGFYKYSATFDVSASTDGMSEEECKNIPLASAAKMTAVYGASGKTMDVQMATYNWVDADGNPDYTKIVVEWCSTIANATDINCNLDFTYTKTGTVELGRNNVAISGTKVIITDSMLLDAAQSLAEDEKTSAVGKFVGAEGNSIWGSITITKNDLKEVEVNGVKVGQIVLNDASQIIEVGALKEGVDKLVIAVTEQVPNYTYSAAKVAVDANATAAIKLSDVDVEIAMSEKSLGELTLTYANESGTSSTLSISTSEDVIITYDALKEALNSALGITDEDAQITSFVVGDSNTEKSWYFYFNNGTIETYNESASQNTINQYEDRNGCPTEIKITAGYASTFLSGKIYYYTGNETAEEPPEISKQIRTDVSYKITGTWTYNDTTGTEGNFYGMPIKTGKYTISNANLKFTNASSGTDYGIVLRNEAGDVVFNYDLDHGGTRPGSGISLTGKKYSVEVIAETENWTDDAGNALEETKLYIDSEDDNMIYASNDPNSFKADPGTAGKTYYTISKFLAGTCPCGGTHSYIENYKEYITSVDEDAVSITTTKEISIYRFCDDGCTAEFIYLPVNEVYCLNPEETKVYILDENDGYRVKLNMTSETSSKWKIQRETDITGYVEGNVGLDTYGSETAEDVDIYSFFEFIVLDFEDRIDGVGGAGVHGISFAKTDGLDGFKFKVAKTEYKLETNDHVLDSLRNGLKEHENINCDTNATIDTESIGTDATLELDLQYPELRFTLKAPDTATVADNYYYSYTQTATISAKQEDRKVTIIGTHDDSDPNINIILAENMHLHVGHILGDNINLYGNGNNLKYWALKDAKLIDLNESNITEVDFVVGFREYTQVVTSQKGSDGKFKDVSFHGNIRNISESVTDGFYGLGNNSSITSQLSITAIKVGTTQGRISRTSYIFNNHVKEVNDTTPAGVTYQNKNVIVFANAEDGINGLGDTTLYHGSAGNNGSDAGKVTIKSDFKGIILLGRAGIGGYGGNGGHGRGIDPDDGTLKIGNGGNGGQAGSNGDAGEVVDERGNPITNNVITNTLKFEGKDQNGNTIEFNQFGGNGGMGALGYFTDDENLVYGTKNGSGNLVINKKNQDKISRHPEKPVKFKTDTSPHYADYNGATRVMHNFTAYGKADTYLNDYLKLQGYELNGKGLHEMGYQDKLDNYFESKVKNRFLGYNEDYDTNDIYNSDGTLNDPQLAAAAQGYLEGNLNTNNIQKFYFFLEYVLDPEKTDFADTGFKPNSAMDWRLVIWPSGEGITIYGNDVDLTGNVA